VGETGVSEVMRVKKKRKKKKSPWVEIYGLKLDLTKIMKN
jgi:hypothetical protein